MKFFKTDIHAARQADLTAARFQLHDYEATLSHAMHMVAYLQETIQRLEQQLAEEVENKS